MLQKTSLPSILASLAVPVLDAQKVEAYKKIELAKQRTWLWHNAHALHPTIACRLDDIGLAFAMTFVVSVMATVAMLSNGITPLWLSLSTGAGGVACLVLGLYCKQAHRGNGLQWRMDAVDTYRQMLRRQGLPLQAEMLMTSIRKQTKEGVFRVEYLGDDPILYIGEPWKDDFGAEPKNFPILVWDKFGNVVEL